MKPAALQTFPSRSRQHLQPAAPWARKHQVAMPFSIHVRGNQKIRLNRNANQLARAEGRNRQARAVPPPASLPRPRSNRVRGCRASGQSPARAGGVTNRQIRHSILAKSAETMETDRRVCPAWRQHLHLLLLRYQRAGTAATSAIKIVRGERNATTMREFLLALFTASPPAISSRKERLLMGWKLQGSQREGKFPALPALMIVTLLQIFDEKKKKTNGFMLGAPDETLGLIHESQGISE